MKHKPIHTIDLKTLWRYPVCAVLILAGIVLAVAANVHDGDPALNLAGMACCFLGALLHMAITKRKEASQPIMAVQARVLCRRKGMWRGTTYCSQVWTLTFRTETGEDLEFQVSELDYGRWNDGDEALLRYRGEQFLSFGRGPLTDEHE